MLNLISDQQSANQINSRNIEWFLRTGKNLLLGSIDMCTTIYQSGKYTYFNFIKIFIESST